MHYIILNVQIWQKIWLYIWKNKKLIRRWNTYFISFVMLEIFIHFHSSFSEKKSYHICILYGESRHSIHWSFSNKNLIDKWKIFVYFFSFKLHSTITFKLLPLIKPERQIMEILARKHTNSNALKRSCNEGCV